jgi:hypothetical protein
MCNATTISRVRNYQGNNRFIMAMKESLKKWGNLTERQLIATENALKSETTIDINAISELMKPIANYNGESSFICDIKSKLLKYGTLSERQIDAALKAIEKENNKKNTVVLDFATPGETIKIGRNKGQELRQKYGLKFNPILIDIVEIKAMSPKAVHFAGKMTIKRGNVCMSCAKTLTDEFSMLTRMGKCCAENMGVKYITDKSQAEEFRNEYLKRVEEIGVMEFWIPKSKIIKWEGKTEVLLKMIN